MQNVCGVGFGYIGNKYDWMYVEQKLKVLYSMEKFFCCKCEGEILM